MKTILYICAAAVSFISLSSCQQDDGTGRASGEGELTLSPTVEEMVTAGTRAIGNDFFDVGYPIDVTIRSNRPGATDEKYEYIYRQNGTFTGEPGYRFSLDDSYITSLVAVWPTDSIRKNGVLTDQRELEDHRKADWMTAKASLKGIVSTDAPVPLNFNRDNSMLYFQLAGQNTQGLSITSLVLELNVADTARAFWAFCGTDDGHAELIIAPDTKIESKDNYLIGRLRVSNSSKEYTIIFPKTDLDLQPGTRHLVTLTPVGYDMDIFLFIGGWWQYESGIGIPFTPPADDGSFTIYTPEQLIAMSFLIRHYNPSEFDWPALTYHISDTIEMTEEYAEMYIPLPATFAGSIMMNGLEIDRIEYGSGQVLYLYETE